MIKLSNGHSFEYMVASGALAYDGLGWTWERPLVSLGLIRPELFTIVTKSLTLHPRVGNLRWYKPWECVRLIPGGAVNKVGLTNPGFEWWMETVAPNIKKNGIKIVVSLFGEAAELVEMTERLANVPIVGIEYNVSCPNHKSVVESAVEAVKEGKKRTHHPIILKFGADQPYLEILESVHNCIEGVSWNSVPWAVVFPGVKSPLHKLEEKVGGGGGGVSGKPAQLYNWNAIIDVKTFFPKLPVVGSSVMRFEDLDEVREFGASAVSFGCIHLRAPHLPTHIVIKEQKRIRRRS